MTESDEYAVYKAKRAELQTALDEEMRKLGREWRRVDTPAYPIWETNVSEGVYDGKPKSISVSIAGYKFGVTLHYLGTADHKTYLTATEAAAQAARAVEKAMRA